MSGKQRHTQRRRRVDALTRQAGAKLQESADLQASMPSWTHPIRRIRVSVRIAKLTAEAQALVDKAARV